MTKTAWDKCETDEDVRQLIEKKSQPDSRGRYHCVVCGKYADPDTRKDNQGQPRCEDHDFSWPGGMNYAEYQDLVRFANGY